MSCLKLYAPDDCEVETLPFAEFSQNDEYETQSYADEEPIVSWKPVDRSGSPSLMEILARSRAVYQNKRCRDCGRPTVNLVQRDDALLGKNRDPIPGSATIVGFSCDYCRNAWSM